MLGGAAGALVATPHEFTGGASGGVFGVAAAATLVMSRRGVRFWDTGIRAAARAEPRARLLPSHISIGGHIGGLLAGALTAELMMRARKAEMPALGYVGAGAVAFLSVAISLRRRLPLGLRELGRANFGSGPAAGCRREW